MASSYSPPSNYVSGDPYSGTPPSDDYGNPMDPYDYEVPEDNSNYDDYQVPGNYEGYGDMDENEEHEIRPEEEDPETIHSGVLDMGEVVAQFLGLAIDPYPKAEDVGDKDYIETKPSDKPNPFAKLASLKTKE